MLRLCSESSRPYPVRSAQRGHRLAAHEPAGENVGWGYRLNKSRRYTGEAAPGIDARTNGSQTGRHTMWPRESATGGNSGSDLAEVSRGHSSQTPPVTGRTWCRAELEAGKGSQCDRQAQ